MAAKKTDTGNEQQDKGSYLHKSNWEVMKPFVHFAIKAMAVVGSALWAVVKVFPKALEHKAGQNKDGKVIKL